MVFSSISFLFYFLPAFLLLYLFTRFRNGFLLLASLFFYAWGEMEYVLLLIFSCLANYGAGRLIAASRENRRRFFLFIGIAVNLSLICFYKYLAFIIQSVNPVLNLMSLPPIKEMSVHLPLGISFFTFQAISYIVDVYRNRDMVEKNPVNLALYISMFPQLVAGPIVRFNTITEQIKSRSLSLSEYTEGIRFFIIGLAQKILIANSVAKAADAIYALPSHALDFSLSWAAAICYAIQIYYDFSGYSHMAIGLGLMMGFHLPENFNYPYISQSITEFWRRWHITLSTWLRDYLYIPLGGNRKGIRRTYINLLIVFFLCGLWHGAGWTFVAWGLFHGLFMVLERVGFNQVLARLPRALRHLYCIGAVTIGWVLFRAETFGRAGRHLKAMAGLGTGDGTVYSVWQYLQGDVIIALCIGILCSTPLLEKLPKGINDFLSGKQPVISQTWAISSQFVHFLLLSAIFTAAVMNLASGAYNPFIYFRF